MAEVTEAARDFILEYFPEIPADRIIFGYQRQATLPKTEDFLIISLESVEHPGTGVQEYADEATKINGFYRYEVLLDFIGTNTDEQRARAFKLVTIARSPEAAVFFDSYSIGVNYANGAEYLPYIYEDNSYTARYRVPLNLSRWETAEISVTTAKEIDFKVKNIDTYE